MGTVGRVLVLLLLSASHAFAQNVDKEGVPYRAWDIDAAVGFHSSHQSDLSGRQGDERQQGWEPAWLFAADIGHYWSSHIKGEAGVAHLSRTQYYEQQSLLDSSGREVGYRFSTTHVRQTQLIVAATYQFLENAFAHPYVSAGARVGLLSFHRHETRYLYSSRAAPPLPEPPRESDGLDLRVRPFVAVGSKSYFSERVFMRPELMVALGERGVTQVGLRLGIGIDF
jgi:hypothetical protein